MAISGCGWGIGAWDVPSYPRPENMSCLEPDEPFSRVVQQFLGIHLNVVLTDRHVTVGEHLIHALILEEKPFTERLGGVFRGCTLERKAAWGPGGPEELCEARVHLGQQTPLMASVINQSDRQVSVHRLCGQRGHISALWGTSSTSPYSSCIPSAAKWSPQPLGPTSTIQIKWGSSWFLLPYVSSMLVRSTPKDAKRAGAKGKQRMQAPWAPDFGGIKILIPKLWYFKERQCQRMLKLPHNCTHLTR